MALIDELQECKYKMDSVDRNIKLIDERMSDLDIVYNDLSTKLDSIITSRQYYKKAIDVIYERSIQELKDILNSALCFIFKDKNLEIDVELSDKRGKSLNFVIKNNDKRVSLKHGMGMGVKCVVSAILHIYYLQCKNSKILMLDEAYSNISKEYISYFFEFISTLCQKLRFKLVIITHDERFIDYANKVYQVSDGNVRILKDTDEYINRS